MVACQMQGAGVAREEKSLTIEEGILKVGAEMNYGPMEYKDENGEYCGVDMELIQAVAEELGLQTQVVEMPWDSIFTGLEKGEYDVIASSLSKTREREEKYALTESYMDNSICLVVPKDSDIAAVKDLDGKLVGVHLCSTSDLYVQQQIESGIDIKLKQYETVVYAFEELKKGNLQAVISDEVVAAYCLKGVESSFKTVWKSTESEPFCMCVLKENEELREELDRSLDAVKQKGIVDALKEKYF